MGFLARLALFSILGTIVGTFAARAGDETLPIPVDPLLILPFVFLLASIAILPFINRRWWDRNYPYVSSGFGGLIVLYYFLLLKAPERMLHVGLEYVSFIFLIGSLFVVSGGIHIRIRGRSTPLTNVFLLASGAVIANILGTTGASMILIRPFLRVNRYRLKPYHVVFFIFLVSNIGGALTPIGDPPLFLGYLQGIPFFWVLSSVWPIWLFVTGLVLLIFYLFDYRSFRKHEAGIAPDSPENHHEQAEVSGFHNIAFLAIILGAVFIERPLFLRELLMLFAAASSYITTKKEIHTRNDFNFVPIKEVAILFAGIFATMVPALDWLEVNASQVGITTAGQFFWSSGALSSVLDNAPTYLSFLSASIGLFVDENIVRQVQQLIMTHGSDIATVTGSHAAEVKGTFEALMRYHSELVAAGSVPLREINVCYLLGNHPEFVRAISLGAVFFGAMTYIGNGPNFMVKSIAEQAGAKVPGFGGYILKYSIPLLLPIFALVWLLFFR